MFHKLIRSKVGIIIISIIWGLGISCLFRKVCHGKDCIIIKAPVPSEVQKYTYSFNKKCYKYNPYTVKCGNSKVII